MLTTIITNIITITTTVDICTYTNWSESTYTFGSADTHGIVQTLPIIIIYPYHPPSPKSH